MNEHEYYAGEFTDNELNAAADGGDFYLEESGFHFKLTAKDIEDLIYEGNDLISRDILRDENEKRKHSSHENQGWIG